MGPNLTGQNFAGQVPGITGPGAVPPTINPGAVPAGIFEAPQDLSSSGDTFTRRVNAI